jgi:hypothetical protein
LRSDPACHARLPWPRHGVADEARPQGIALNVAHDSQQMLVVLDRKCLESPLPDSPTGPFAPVKATHVRRQQPLHPTGKRTRLSRNHHEVKVVRHEARRQELDGRSSLRGGDQFEERAVVGGATKHLRAIVAAVDDVVADPRSYGSCRARHARIFAPAGRRCRSRTCGERTGMRKPKPA